MSERVPALIAIVPGIGQFADAHAIEHDPNDALEFCSLLALIATFSAVIHSVLRS